YPRVLPPIPPSAIGIGNTVLRLAWGGAVAARFAREAHLEIGALVPQALSRAICSDAPSDPSAQAAAVVLANRLAKTQPPDDTGRAAGRVRRVSRRLRSVLPYRNRVPKVAEFGEVDFELELAKWLKL